MPQSEVQEGSPSALKHLHGTTALLQWLYQEYQQHPPPPPNQHHHPHSVSPTHHHPPPSPFGAAAVATAASSSTSNNTPQQQQTRRAAGKVVNGGGTPPSPKRNGVGMMGSGGADQLGGTSACSSPGRPYNRLEGEGGGAGSQRRSPPPGPSSSSPGTAIAAAASPSRSTAAVVQWAPNSNEGNRSTKHTVVSGVGVMSRHNRTKHGDDDSVGASGKAKMRLSLSIEDVGSTGDTTNDEPHRMGDADRRERTSPVFSGAPVTTTTPATAAESASNPLAAPPHHHGDESPSQDGSPHEMFFSMTVTPMEEKGATNFAHHQHHQHPARASSNRRSQQKGPSNATRNLSSPSPSSPTSRCISSPSTQQQQPFPQHERREATGNAPAAAALSNSSSGSSFAPRSPAWHGHYPREEGSSSSASLLPHHHRPHHHHHPHHRLSAVSRSSSIGSATPLRSVGSGGGRRQSGQQSRSPQESTISEQLARAQVQRRMALARLSARLRDGTDTSATSTKFLRQSQQQQRTTSPPQPHLSLLSGSPSNSSFGSTAPAFRYPALQHPQAIPRAATSMSSSSQERESPTNATEPPRPQSSLSTFSRGGNTFHKIKPSAVSASEAQQEEARASAQRRVTDLRRAQRQKKDEENRLLDEILVARGRHQQQVELSAVQRSRMQSR